MDIHQIVELSGLSRDQVNQLASRYGVHIWGRNAPGGARDFTSADAFNFYLAGQLYRAGVSMLGIRDVLAGLPLPRLDQHGSPVDYLGFAAGSENDFLILRLNDAGLWEGHVVPSLEGGEVWVAGGLALVVDLAAAVRCIKEAQV